MVAEKLLYIFGSFRSLEAAVMRVISRTMVSSAWLGPETTTISLRNSLGISSSRL